MRLLNRPNLRVWPGAFRGARLAAVAMLLMATFFFMASASATVMKYADMTRLIEISDVIVHGTVADQRTYFDEAQGFVVTDTTLKIETAFYGKVEGTLTFQQWGGTYQDKTYVLPGDAEFKPGEEVILFLYRGNGQQANGLYLSALSQSKFTVYKNDNGKTMVARDLSEVAFLLDETDRHIGPIHESPESLKSFLATLRSQIAGIKGGSQ